MAAISRNQNVISIPASLKVIGIFGATFGLIGTLLATLTYLSGHPDFSMFTTFLSDIGDTPGWPQVLFNSTTLIMAPIRYLIIILVALCLSQIGAGSKFVKTILIIGAISTFGTVMMTAVPFSISKAIHLAGIPLYFFGLAICQTIVGIKEWSLRVPRILPVLSFLLVIASLVLFVLVVLFEANVVGRTAAPIWQWIGFFISLIWVYAHSVILHKMDETQ
jgi:hypothetical protein